jgi:PAS domain S-box-containing protein
MRTSPQADGWYTLKRYALPFLLVALAALFAELFRPMFRPVPSLLFTPPIIIAAWYGGLGPGLLATALGFFACNYMLIPPFHSLHAEHAFRWTRLGLFLFTGTVTSWLIDALHLSRWDYLSKQRELWALQARHDRVIETLREGVWVVDADGQTVSVSGRLADLLGRPAADLAGLCPWDCMTAASREEALRLWEQSWLGAGEQHCFRFRRPDGSELEALVTCNPLYDPEARFAGVVCLVADAAACGCGRPLAAAHAGANGRSASYCPQ